MKIRLLNGYRVIYKPEHPSAYTSDNWNGWIYEHRYLMELELGRPLSDTEVCHHLDGNPLNNLVSNLIVVANQGMHSKLHRWIDDGARMAEEYTPSERDERYLGTRELEYCKICELTLQHKQIEYCSNTCRAFSARKVIRPEKSEILKHLETMSYVKVGKMYGVSDNAIRKWLK